MKNAGLLKVDEGVMLRERYGLSLVISALLSVSIPGVSAVAQEAAPEKPKTTSSGLSASINNIAIPNNNIIVAQIALQNISKSRIYVLHYGSNRAATDTGAFAYINQSQTSGVNTCFSFNGQDDYYSYKKCFEENDADKAKAKELEAYTYIEPNDTVLVSVSYNFSQDISRAHTVSFMFDAIVRNGTGDADLPGQSPEKMAGPAHPVNLNFSLIPLKKD